MDILVTGGTGYIGSMLVKELTKRGHRIRCLVREKSDRSELPRGIVLWEGDLTLPETLENITEGINAVFHLAAVGNINAVSSIHYKQYRKVNVEGTENLLKECLRHRPKMFIYLSSMVVEYEKTTLPYERTKQEAEQLCLDYFKRFGLPVVVIRPPMVWDWNARGEFKKLVNFVKLGIVPVIGNGTNPIILASRPYLVKQCIRCLKEKPGSVKSVKEESLTYNELLKRIGEHYGIRHYFRVKIPIRLVYPFVLIEEFFAKKLGFVPFMTTKRLKRILKEQTR